MTVYGPLSPRYGREGRPRRRRTIKSTKASCDRIWSQLVRARAGYRCERCGATPEESQLHAHHVHGRNNHRLRWEPRNGITFCASCHRWTHDYPLLFGEWFRDHRYEDVDYLAVELQKGLMKRNLHDYLELEKSLSEQLKESQ